MSDPRYRCRWWPPPKVAFSWGVPAIVKGIDLLRELRLHAAIFESGSVESKSLQWSFVRSMAHPVGLVGLVRLIEM
jgi:hypothetical protein